MKSGVWAVMDQKIIDNAVAQRRQCVQALGRFEQLKYTNKQTQLLEKVFQKHIKDNFM